MLCDIITLLTWGLSQGICSGISISQFVLCNLGTTISIKSEKQTTIIIIIKIRESCIDCFLITSAAFHPGFDVLIDSCFHRFIHVFIQQPLFLQVPGSVLCRGNQCKTQTKCLPAQCLELMEEDKQMYNKA